MVYYPISEGERETCIASNCKRIIETYADEIPWYAYGGDCDTTGSMIWYVESDDFDNLTVLKEYKVDPDERWANLDYE